MNMCEFALKSNYLSINPSRSTDFLHVLTLNLDVIVKKALLTIFILSNVRKPKVWQRQLKMMRSVKA